MFKLRVLSILVMLPAVIAGILFLPTLYVALLSGIVFTIAAWEWLNMTLLNTYKTRFLLLVFFVILALSLVAKPLASYILFWLSLVWWLCGFVGICYFPRGTELWRQILLQPFIGLLMFVPAWLSFNELHAQGPAGPIWVLLGCALIWGADVGAYCTGKLWGQAKLIPAVSPGKTWAGFYGAIATGCLLMSLFYFWFKPEFSYLHAIWLAIITVIFAVIGDLVESLLKRVYGYKDSGKLIPGHGGAYDRIDSMLAAFPIYMLGLQIILNLRIMAV